MSGVTAIKSVNATGGNLLREPKAMSQWFLPALSEVLSLAEMENFSSPAPMNGRENRTSNLRRSAQMSAQQRLKAEREWSGAIAALENLLLQQLSGLNEGLILSGPAPVLSDPLLVSGLASWTFTPDPLNPVVWLNGHHHRHRLHLLPMPAGEEQTVSTPSTQAFIPLLVDDPLKAEQFCVVLTPSWGLVMVLGENLQQEPAFQFSFEPEVLVRVWQVLRPRVLLAAEKPVLEQLDAAWHQLMPVEPPYKTVMQFSQLLLKYLPDPIDFETEPAEVQLEKVPAVVDIAAENLTTSYPLKNNTNHSSLTITNPPHTPKKFTKLPATAKTNLSREVLEQHFESSGVSANKGLKDAAAAQDVELLQAIAHEVRTPLATIRTLTRLLLRRKNLEPDVIKRLEMIDRECSEQIDRFNLIFRAVELETSQTKRSPVQLTSTSVAEVLDSCIPRWQKQAAKRNLTLEVVLPQKMPPVVSDPTMLDQVLTGVIENFTASAPAGAHVRVQVSLAGDQLKVQLHSQTSQDNSAEQSETSPLKSIGQLLMFQPETGNLILNLAATKNLFQALGGKLIVRQRPQQGEVLTIFLPLE